MERSEIYLKLLTENAFIYPVYETGEMDFSDSIIIFNLGATNCNPKFSGAKEYSTECEFYIFKKSKKDIYTNLQKIKDKLIELFDVESFEENDEYYHDEKLYAYKLTFEING